MWNKSRRRRGRKLAGGLASGSERNPRLSERQRDPHPGEGARNPRHPFQGAGSVWFRIPGVRKKRIPWLISLHRPAVRGARMSLVSDNRRLMSFVYCYRTSGVRKMDKLQVPDFRCGKGFYNSIISAKCRFDRQFDQEIR